LVSAPDETGWVRMGNINIDKPFVALAVRLLCRAWALRPEDPRYSAKKRRQMDRLAGALAVAIGCNSSH
jgi:hypothetical protein